MDSQRYLWSGRQARLDSTAAYLTKISTVRKLGVTATYKLDSQRAEPSVWITFTVGSGFTEVIVGDRILH